MYLGRDVLTSRMLEGRGVSPGPRIPIADRLRETAFAVRQSYIDSIGALGASHAPLSWWMTGLSERSPFSSDVLLHLCYLTVCTKYLRDHEGDLVVFSENKALLRSLWKNLAPMEGVRVVSLDAAPRAFLDAARSRVSSLMRLGHFALASTSHVLLARLHAPAGSGPPAKRDQQGGSVVLLSWADARSFPATGTYADPYLGEMGEELTRSGHDVTRIVQVIPTFPYREAARRTAGMGGRVRLREEFLFLLDPLRAVAMAFSRFPVLGEIPPWNGLDVSDIILGEHLANGRSTAPAKACLAFLAGKRLGARLGPRDIVYPFENHSWEKLLCLGIREASPGTRLLGYAHATVPPLELSYSRSAEHEAGMPLPDVILVNGARSRDLLARSGFDPARIAVAGAFRYPGIHAAPDSPGGRPGRGILIATTVVPEESLELLSTCIEAFSGTGGPEILVKCHPTLPFERLSPHLPALPPCMTVSMDPIGNLLARAGVLVYGGTSTVALEALARGVPCLHVRSGLLLDMDILTGTGLGKSVSGPRELREEALRMLGSPETGSPAAARQALREFFEPPHPEILEANL